MLNEVPYLVIISISIILLFFVFKKVKNYIADYYYPLHKAIITRSFNQNITELKKAFPDYFKDKKQ
jgi:hypothetical protein